MVAFRKVGGEGQGFKGVSFALMPSLTDFNLTKATTYFSTERYNKLQNSGFESYTGK